ncbi:glutathione S-transferase family protein [Sporobolomyces koalae]|uniref:glutathione S-transferase family protein n=1 Tax=Sporobolomyces koalae TaxID=500713 RepID=UPI0031827308
MPRLPILYVLVGQHGGPQFSPTVFKSLLCLWHKGVNFEIRELVWTELRAKQEAWKKDRPTLPTLELPDEGRIIGDSNEIAAWLEEAYPDSPSLFLPDSTPSNASPGNLQAAKNYHKYVESTFGSPALLGVPFSPFFSAIHQGILGLIKEDKDREYFTSDTKLGVPQGWQKLETLNQSEAIKQAKTFVKPLEALLKTSPFLNGKQPGMVDYTLFGRYAFQRVADPSTAKQIWKSPDTPRVAKWIERIEMRYAEQFAEQKSRWPADADS